MSTQGEHKKEKGIKRNEESLRDLWDNIKHNNICIIGVPEGEESEQGIGNLFEEIMVENFPILVKESHISPGRTETTNQDESKETHTKTHHS